VRDQLRALAAAGACTTLFCYGSGEGPAPEDLDVVRIPRALSPRGLRAGPSPGKPLADAALVARLVAEGRRHRFDAVLAHNGEAALAALLARAATRIPVVYVAHTLLGRELDAYASPTTARAWARFGEALDRLLAARSDAVIALSAAAQATLSAYTRATVARIPPGLGPAPAPSVRSVEQACAAAGVRPGAFALYTGNVDRYQALERLAAAARRVPELPVVVATHGNRKPEDPILRCVRTSPAEARALTHGCAVAVAPRSRPGGFPIKLLNYMEAERAIVGHESLAEELPHDRCAWLVSEAGGVDELAAALRDLAADRPRAERLGRGARARLEAEHAWPALAARTLELVKTLGP